MPRAKNKKTMGKGAVVSLLSKYVHPSEHIRKKYPNPIPGHRFLDNCVVVRKEVKKITRKNQLAVIITHDDYKTDDGALIELHCVERWLRVDKEGPSDYFFDVVEAPRVDTPAAGTEEETPAPILAIAASGRQQLDEEDVRTLRGLVPIDDDNEPAPENIPDAAAPAVVADDIFEEWGHNGICQRRQVGGQQTSPSVNFPSGLKPTILQLFDLFFPKQFVKDVILLETNKHLEQNLSYGELLVFIGLWFLMSTTYVESRRDFWSNADIDPFTGAPMRFGTYMSRNRFESITRALRFTNLAPPTYKDGFWEIRQLVDAWNENMKANFIPSWISCLDESMMKWLSAYTCPGFMCVPRKPWPFGNEWHSICCAMSYIMYAIEIVEGKDEPKDRPNKEYSNLGKTVGLLLRLTHKLWYTSKVVVLDSGFCVLQGIIELRKRGVFAAALIKKRRYWPKYIRGDDIKAHFEDKEVGAIDAWPGTLDGQKFQVFCMKEPDYIMSLMSTYGTLERMGVDNKRSYTDDSGEKRRATFKYPEVVFNHFKYRDAVDGHNGTRMDPIALEETVKTTRWSLRVFQFLLAVTEVNIKNALTRIFKEPERSQQEFRKLFAKALLENDYVNDETSPRRSKRSKIAISGHKRVPLPKFRTFDRAGRIIPTQTQWIQRNCNGCKKRVRTYCKCTPGVMLCEECYWDHVYEGGIESPSRH